MKESSLKKWTIDDLKDITQRRNYFHHRWKKNHHYDKMNFNEDCTIKHLFLQGAQNRTIQQTFNNFLTETKIPFSWFTEKTTLEIGEYIPWVEGNRYFKISPPEFNLGYIGWIPNN